MNMDILSVNVINIYLRNLSGSNKQRKDDQIYAHNKYLTMHLTFNVCYRNYIPHTFAGIFDGAENHGRGQNHSRDHEKNLKECICVCVHLSFSVTIELFRFVTTKNKTACADDAVCVDT